MHMQELYHYSGHWDHLCTSCNAAISGWQGLCLGGAESLLCSLADGLEQSYKCLFPQFEMGVACNYGKGMERQCCCSILFYIVLGVYCKPWCCIVFYISFYCTVVGHLAAWYPLFMVGERHLPTPRSKQRQVFGDMFVRFVVLCGCRVQSVKYVILIVQKLRGAFQMIKRNIDGIGYQRPKGSEFIRVRPIGNDVRP